MKKLVLLFAVLLTTVSASAYDFEVNGIYYIKLSDGKSVEVTYNSSYTNSYSGDVIIPSTVTYKGTTYSVTSIGELAFNDCSGLTSVEIPNSVTTIGNRAFIVCRGLTSVVIPNSVTEIGDGAFQSCSGLTSVVIGSSVTSIGGVAFQYCTSLTSVEIPNSVTEIGDYAFNFCTSLTSVVIPNSVTEIGGSAFYGCSGLTSAVIGNSVTSIGRYAFYQCDGLTEIASHNTTPPSAGSYCFLEVPKNTCILKVPVESVELYKAAKRWKDFFNIVGIEVDAINEVKSDERRGGQAFDLRGQRVGDEYKGLIIRDGRKVINK